MTKTKKNELIADLDEYNFDQMIKKSKRRREQKRYLAFAHIKEGKSFTETAKMVRVSLRALMNWIKKFREGGIKTLKDSYGGGRTPHVPPHDHENFRQAVLDLQKSRSGERINPDIS